MSNYQHIANWTKKNAAEIWVSDLDVGCYSDDDDDDYGDDKATIQQHSVDSVVEFYEHQATTLEYYFQKDTHLNHVIPSSFPRIRINNRIHKKVIKILRDQCTNNAYCKILSMLSGATGCGKTEWCMRLINNDEMICPRIENVIFSYTEWQPSYAGMDNVKFVDGLLPLSQGKENMLYIIDDQTAEAGKYITALFTKGSHHKNISVIFITQNLFHHNREIRTITLNAHYIISFKSPRDQSAINTLASQMYPGTFLKQVFVDATREPHSYLLIDLKQSTPNHFRLHTKVFLGEERFVYVNNSNVVDETHSFEAMGRWVKHVCADQTSCTHVESTRYITPKCAKGHFKSPFPWID